MGKRFILEASKQSRKPRRLARLLTAFMAITRITAGRNDRRKTSIQHSGRSRPSGRDDGREQGDRQRGRCRHAGRLLRAAARSEEHTSELQSLMRISYAVCCLKKKNKEKRKK